MGVSELVNLTATELAQRIRNRDISAREVMEAHLAQIARVNPKVNAIVSQLPEEQVLRKADEADAKLARGDEVGPLHGLPIAHKDLIATKDIRTTFGSPIYKDFVPEQDAIIVERLKKAGAIAIGKTNTPEFGAGSQTFNEVFGTTLNPYDVTKTCGGSSGGAAVALACRMLPIADGSDLGGSLRNPANFNNIVGFRPSPGRVPSIGPTGWNTLGVQGPMARTVDGVALMLSAIAGPDSRSPISIDQPGAVFAESLERDFSGVRIAYSRDLGGLPVDSRVTSAIESSVGVFESLGCNVEEAAPDFSGADFVFKTLRAWGSATTRADLLEKHRGQIKATVVKEIEDGMKLTGADVGRAEVMRTDCFQRFHNFMETYEFMILPVNQVPPFDVTQEYPTEINGVQMETYIDWMKSCYYITITGHPSISMPCEFTPEGLPVGVQIVGRYRSEFAVLQIARAFEQATELWKRLPSVVQPA